MKEAYFFRYTSSCEHGNTPAAFNLVKSSYGRVKLILAYTVLLAGFAFISCNSKQNNPKKVAETENKEKFEKADEDAKFLVNAYSDGLYGIHLNELVQQTRVTKKNILLIQTVGQDYSKANMEIKQFASAKQISLPMDLTKEQQNRLQELKNMKGNKLDAASLNQTENNLRDYISLFEAEVKQTNDSSLKTFVNKTLPIFHQHLDKVSAADGDRIKPQVPIVPMAN